MKEMETFLEEKKALYLKRAEKWQDHADEIGKCGFSNSYIEKEIWMARCHAQEFLAKVELIEELEAVYLAENS